MPGKTLLIAALSAVAPFNAAPEGSAGLPPPIDPGDFAPSRAEFLAFAAGALPRLRPTDQVPGGGGAVELPSLGTQAPIHPDARQPAGPLGV